MKKLTRKQLEKIIFDFNSTYKVGDKVEIFKIKGGNETIIDQIKSAASILGDHTTVTWLKEKGCYNLTFIKGLAK